jgi:hypothetical protein
MRGVARVEGKITRGEKGLPINVITNIPVVILIDYKI